MTRLATLARLYRVQRCFASSSPASSSNAAAAVGKDERAVVDLTDKKPKTRYPRPPSTAHHKGAPKSTNITNEEFHNEAIRTGTAARLYDYQRVGELAARLPIVERIAFVNPYERDWTRVEKKWHRAWHPTLMSPRKAWALPPLPSYFDILGFYQYVTKTRLVRGDAARTFFDDYFHGLVPPTEKFRSRSNDALQGLLTSTRFDSAGEQVNAILASLVDEGITSVAHHQEKFRDYRLAYSVRNESFWIRAGFNFLYDKADIVTGEKIKDARLPSKYPGDDRRRLGELAFTLRDNLAAQLRTQQPLAPLFPLDDPQTTLPVFDEDVDVANDVLFAPKVLHLWPDPEPLWQCPGFMVDSGETHTWVNLGVKSLPNLDKQLKRWYLSTVASKGELSEYDRTVDELFAASAVSTLFATLNAQAHILGYTQYNELDRPLVSQLIVSDGRRFAFAVAQLNTIAINIEVDGFVNDRTNVCYVDGPYDLYPEGATSLGAAKEEKKNTESKEEGTPKTSSTNHVLSRILQMLLKT